MGACRTAGFARVRQHNAQSLTISFDVDQIWTISDTHAKASRVCALAASMARPHFTMLAATAIVCLDAYLPPTSSPPAVAANVAIASCRRSVSPCCSAVPSLRLLGMQNDHLQAGNAIGAWSFTLPSARALASRTTAPMAKASSAGERGLAAALAYATISAAWYLLGMCAYLASSTPPPASPLAAPLSRARRRLATAWIVTCAASQVTTPWRAAAAVGLSPFLNRVLLRRRASANSSSTGDGSFRATLLPALAYGAVLAATFSAGVAALGAREVALSLASGGSR